MDAIRTASFWRRDSSAEGKRYGLWCTEKSKDFGFPQVPNCFWLSLANTLSTAAQHLAVRLG